MKSQAQLMGRLHSNSDSEDRSLQWKVILFSVTSWTRLLSNAYSVVCNASCTMRCRRWKGRDHLSTLTSASARPDDFSNKSPKFYESGPRVAKNVDAFLLLTKLQFGPRKEGE